MATLKQKKALKLVENGRSMKEVMIEAGYSPATATHPDKLTKAKGWLKLLDKYLPDDNLLEVHKGLLKNKHWEARNAGLDKAYKVKGKYETGITINQQFNTGEMNVRFREAEANDI